MNNSIVQATFETTTMESPLVKKFSRLPSDWATWECARKVRYFLEHNDHMHVVFQAKENVSRKGGSLLNDCPVPAEDWFTAKSARQYSRDIYSLLQYFKFMSEQLVHFKFVQFG
nr:hypothetical transcript [Hymenolepis microstoma]CDS29538.1 hypothetical transcript [Hymenolepis microstoma]